MVSVAQLVQHLHDTVPMTRCMQISAACDGEGDVVLEAPLEPNVNDKGTAFGGTLATISTLAGWAMSNIVAHEVSADIDVVVVSGNIAYRAPVYGPIIRAHCRPPADRERNAFIKALAKFGRARIELDVEIIENRMPCVVYRGGYVATTGEARKP